jgi:hypothetical protein
MDCRASEEWDFTYILPQPPGEPAWLVVPTLLQTTWVELPPYFCAALKMVRDVATEYIEMELGTRPHHKFEAYAMGVSQDTKLYLD